MSNRSPQYWYHVRETCNAKWFTQRRLVPCPRCNLSSASVERQSLPWGPQPQSKPSHSSQYVRAPPSSSEAPAEPGIVHSLEELIGRGQRFRCIYADPPWSYDNQASRGAAVNHYPVMTLGEICHLPVAQLAQSSAHLHLWTTNAFLFDARQVLEAWGFSYKSCFVWVKDKMGMGNYWRVSHELLLLGVRGRLPFADNRQRSWVRAARTSHSTKPDVVRELVERVSPAPRLELFGRRSCPGWTVFGQDIQQTLF